MGGVHGQLLQVRGASLLQHLGKPDAWPTYHRHEARIRGSGFSRSHTAEERRPELLDQQVIGCCFAGGNPRKVLGLDHPHQRVHHPIIDRRSPNHYQSGIRIRTAV